MSKDYYNILGVNKNASADQIKKAFREKAHKHHPDKQGGDEAKFKELNQAYQVLSDQKKRSQYDQFGSDFEQAGRGGAGGWSGFEGFSGGGFNINLDDLGDLMGGFGDIFGFGGGDSRSRQGRGRDIEITLNIDFKDAVFGVEREISLRKLVSCPKCQGSGAEPSTGLETCPACHGSGRTIRIQRTILGNMQVQATCPTCQGQGKIIKEKCQHCQGAGAMNQAVNLKLKIPAGINSGESIRFAGQGEAMAKGGQAGDLYVKVRINPDKRFKRQGNDILSKVEISITTAALGGKIEIQTVDGLVELKIPEGTQSGRIIRLKDKGVTNLHGRGSFIRAQGKRGDQLVEIIVKTPIGLSRKQKEMLKELGV